MSGSFGCTRAGVASLALRRLTHSEASSSCQPAPRLRRGVESRRSGCRRVTAAAAGGSGGDGVQGKSGAARRAQDASRPAAEAAAPSSFADVAAALGVDPSDLESDDDAAGDIADGVVGADNGDGLLNSPFAPLLGAVSEEISARWRSAIAGRWSPTLGKPLGPCTPYAYLERKLRPEDAERYAAAGVLPYLTEDEPYDTPDALAGGMELIVGGPASLAAGAPSLAGSLGSIRSPEGPLASTFVLLARQGPGKRRRRYLAKLQLLGGKREGSDVGPLATALREIREETGGLLNAASVRRELLGPVLWVPQGRFALFMYGMPAHQRNALPSAFEKRAPGVNGEVDSLEWVALPELITKARAVRQGIAPFARHVIIQPQLLRHFVVQASKARQTAQAAQAAREAAEQAAAQAAAQAEARKQSRLAAEAARQAAQQAQQAAQAAQQARAQQQAQQVARAQQRAQQQALEEAAVRQAAQARLVALARRAAAHAPVRPVPIAPPGVVARSVNDVAELRKLAPASNSQPTPPKQEPASPPLPPSKEPPSRREHGTGRTHAGGSFALLSRWRPAEKRPRRGGWTRARARRLP